MKRIDLVLVFCLLALGAAVLYRFGRAEARTGPAGGSAADPADLFESVSVLAREYSPSVALEGEGRKPGHLVVRAEPGTAFLGIAAAMMCPAADGAPDFLRGQNVFAVQDGEGLRLSDWIRDRKPTALGASWFVALAVWLDGPDGREWRTAWAPVDLLDLSTTGVAVRPRRNSGAIVRVVTADGSPVPGALVSVDDARYEAGHFRQFAVTDGDGRVRVAGMESDRRWRFSLPCGAGPSGGVVSVVEAVPAAVVRLVVPLGGEWDYTRIRVRAPFRGAALHVDGVGVDGEALPSVWAVSPWLGPGLAPWIPVWLMRRTDGAPAGDLTIRFRGYGPEKVRVGDPDRRLLLRPPPEDDAR